MLVLAYDALTNLGAEEELRMAHAQAYGAALSFGSSKDSPKLKRHIRKLTQTAHPEVRNDGS